MLAKGIKVYKSKVEGKGLVAAQFIPRGSVVWRLDDNEDKLTLDELQTLPLERRKLAYQYKDKFIIVTDSSEFMNHSCDPNTWWSGDETLVARYDIQPRDEITYDYASAETDPRFRLTWKCHCGSKNCRKYISGNDCLNLDFQKRYKDHLTSWVEKYIKNQGKRLSSNYLNMF